MIFKVSTSTLYHCSLPKAFQTPILGDITKVHTGYGIMPPVSHTTDDENWGIPGSSKKVYFLENVYETGAGKR
ncbi:MAG: hypothetical protein NW218_03615 [Saprospiraceae bacterium]|nr:hypothetical protein [Saprospiraceae bacterium]